MRISLMKRTFCLKLIVVVLTLIFYSSGVSQAQDAEQILVTGIILDELTNEGLIGASIKEGDTGNGTVTDIDGSFEISVNNGAELQISYIGYADKTVIASSESMTIFLAQDSEVISEVVVVGYGSQRKSDLTGAISSIGVKELKQLPNTGLEQALQGRSAGVYVTQNSGAPGGAMSIKIRGSGSTLTTEPLYVIDGIPITNDNAGTSNELRHLRW